MALHVVEPGLLTLIVDQGRPRTRSLGVPVGGAADRLSLALGNALVGNALTAAGLEIALAGPTLRADTPLACVVYGAPFTLHGDQHTGPAALQVGVTFTLGTGETLTVGGTKLGMRAYLCVCGGFDEKEVLASRSSLGPLTVGQVLNCGPSEIRARFLPPEVGQMFQTVAGSERLVSLRAVAGPQADWFAKGAFCEREFEVTPASNRMGLRLRGAPLALLEPGREMVSEPVAPGAVQVTRDGQCIILGVDGQTIGGYPKIAHVLAADLDNLGQLRPGQRVRFTEVSQDQASELYRAREAQLREWLMRLEASSGM
jgi:antagonist of KipI